MTDNPPPFGVLGSPTLVILAVGPADRPDSLPAITLYLPAVDPGRLNTAGPAQPAAAGAPASTDAGKKVFQLCAACHGQQGEGGAGANLQLSKRDLAGVIAYVKTPTGTMPKLYPSPLSGADVANVAAYVMTLRK